MNYKFLVGILAMVAFAPSFAETGTAAQSGSTSGAVAGASNAGNSQAITFTSPDKTTVDQNIKADTKAEVSGHTSADTNITGTQTLKNVPAVSAPALTTSNDTCMGSTSGGAAVAGFGITIGSTWTDTNCKRLKNSRELWNMGMKAGALALLCMDKENREALEMTGFECPQTTKAKQEVAAR